MVERFLISDTWRIVTGYLGETDKIRLHAFGVKSGIDPEKINSREIKSERQIFDQLDSLLYLDIDGNVRIYGYRPVLILNRKIKSEARNLHFRFPDLGSTAITVISDILETLGVDSKSVINVNYETKTETLKTLRVSGLDCQSSSVLSGFESVERLFVSSIPFQASDSHPSRLVKRLTFPKPTKIREYYGDVNICRSDTFKMLPELEIYSITGDVADSPEYVFSVFPKLQVYVDDGFVYTRKL